MDRDGRRQQSPRQQDALHLDAAGRHGGCLRILPVILDLTKEPLGFRIPVRHLGGDIHQHLRAVLVQLGDRDPVGPRVAEGGEVKQRVRRRDQERRERASQGEFT